MVVGMVRCCCGRSTRNVENAQLEDPSQVQADVNGDGVVDIQDVVLVAGNLGKSAPNRADVNGDGIVNILDLVLVAGMIDKLAGAPMIYSDGASMLRTTDVKRWLEGVRLLALSDVTSLKGIQYLQQSFDCIDSGKDGAVAQLPKPVQSGDVDSVSPRIDADVQITIYDAKGVLVRQLDLGHQPAGFYTDRGHAAYWDGRNEGGVGCKRCIRLSTPCRGIIRRRAGW